MTSSHSPADDQRKRKREDTSHDTANKGEDTAQDSQPSTQRPRHSPSIALPEDPPFQPANDAMQPPSDNEFVLPLHSDELGRLPIWQDLDGNDSAPLPGSFGNIWPMFGEEAFVDTSGLLDISHVSQGYDPELDAMFASFFPDIGYANTAAPSHGNVGPTPIQTPAGPRPSTSSNAARDYSGMSSLPLGLGYSAAAQFSPLTSPATYESPPSMSEGSIFGTGRR